MWNNLFPIIINIIFYAIIASSVFNIAKIIYKHKKRKGKKIMPTAQSKATRKYEEKAGWMSKTYKLKRETVERFAKACDKMGESQAGILSKLMTEYCDRSEGIKDSKTND